MLPINLAPCTAESKARLPHRGGQAASAMRVGWRTIHPTPRADLRSLDPSRQLDLRLRRAEEIPLDPMQVPDVLGDVVRPGAAGVLVHGISKPGDEPVVRDQPTLDHRLDVPLIARSEGPQLAHDHVDD